MTRRCVICLHRLAQDPDPKVVEVESEVDDWSSDSSGGGEGGTEDVKKSKGKGKLVIESIKDNWVAQSKDCSHIFHNDCLKQWIKVNTSGPITCPTCRKAIDEVQVSKYVKGEVLATYRTANNERPKKRTRTTRSAHECNECERPVTVRSLVTCDSCSLDFHTRCAGLVSRPASSWYCPDCVWNGLDQVVGADRVRGARGGLDGFLARAQAAVARRINASGTSRSLRASRLPASSRRRGAPTTRDRSAGSSRAPTAPETNVEASRADSDLEIVGAPVDTPRTSKRIRQQTEVTPPEQTIRNGGIFRKSVKKKEAPNTDPIALAKSLSSSYSRSNNERLKKLGPVVVGRSSKSTPALRLDLSDEEEGESAPFEYSRRQAMTADAEARFTASGSSSMSRPLLHNVADPNYLQLLFAQFDANTSKFDAASSKPNGVTKQSANNSPLNTVADIRVGTSAQQGDLSVDTHPPSNGASSAPATTDLTCGSSDHGVNGDLRAASTASSLYQYASPLRPGVQEVKKSRERLDDNIKGWVSHNADLGMSTGLTKNDAAEGIEAAKDLDHDHKRPQLNTKYLIKDLISERIKPLYRNSRIDRDKYKTILRDCVHALYRELRSDQFSLVESGSIGRGNWKIDAKGQAQVDDCVKKYLAGKGIAM